MDRGRPVCGATTRQSLRIEPTTRVDGCLRVPGDKSISHRVLMCGAVAEGTTRARGFLPGADCLATMAALRAMGVDIKQPDATTVHISGVGLHGLAAPSVPLDMGNSGTAMRLFTGLLSGQAFDSELVGDASLMQRPMERVAEPLRAMGAEISTQSGCPPLRIRGGRSLTGIDYAMPVASAQVKSAVLLAGLYATDPVFVTEPAVTRDHTERMLAQFGCPAGRRDGRVGLMPGNRLTGASIDVPGDLSSAAFFLLAGSIAGAGELVLENVGLNPTRTGILDILRRMGADIEVTPDADAGVEPAGTIIVRPARLHGIEVPAELVPLAIDEFPLIFVAAALADGPTVIAGAGELRHKESDRIGVMASGLRTLGIEVDEREDGATIQGGRLTGGEIDSAGDHRVAMAFAIAAAAATGPVRIHDTANVATSFPDFVAQARSVGLHLEATDD